MTSDPRLVIKATAKKFWNINLKHYICKSIFSLLYTFYCNGCSNNYVLKLLYCLRGILIIRSYYIEYIRLKEEASSFSIIIILLRVVAKKTHFFINNEILQYDLYKYSIFKSIIQIIMHIKNYGFTYTKYLDLVRQVIYVNLSPRISWDEWVLLKLLNTHFRITTFFPYLVNFIQM